MKVPDRRFPSRARANGGRRVRVARCGCGSETEVNDAAIPPLSDGQVERKLVQRGWFVGKKGIFCPKCNSARPTPAPKGETEIMAPPIPKPTLVPDAPREPTREERRRIMDALEASYDTKAERYQAAGCDADLAKAIDVPRKWVADVRIQFYGEHDRNEAAEAKSALLGELEHRAKDLENKAIALACQCEALRQDVAKARAL